MDPDNFTHILSIKVWSTITENVTDFANINSIVNDIFLKRKQSYNGIDLIWKKYKWTKIKKEFNMGDMVVISPFGQDEVLFESVRKTLTEIEMELKENRKMTDKDTIIFNIVKPISRRIPLSETIGFINLNL